jgi:hypothetical protein
MKLNGLGDLFTTRELKAQAIAGLISLYTGEYPRVTREDTFTKIKLSDKQILKGQELFDSWMGKKPGDIQIEGINDVMTPVFAKKYLWWLIGIPAAFVVLGGVMKR